ncbi:hypothetical protein [Pseudoalteromonas piscicida]|uniref:hypothetical protein n=1 Tax=Pseudoalteromonas piscicida TaxID=43662 RepID=UPI0032C07398
MNKSLVVILAVSLLSACKATVPEPYQKGREPESRTEYSGVEGLVQQQQDQNYLMRKELQDKCDDAKVNLAIAKSDKATKAIKKHQREIKDYCI